MAAEGTAEAAAEAAAAGAADPVTATGPSPPEGCTGEETVEELKQKGNASFKKAQLLRKTTAGRQYLDEAKSYYAQALRQIGSRPATPETLELVCTLHVNLAAVFLLAVPPLFQEAKAAAEIALQVNPRQVKALYRRAQATLEDNREGLPEEALQAAHVDMTLILEIEPQNKQVFAECERVRRRLAVIEEARRVPPPHEIIEKIPTVLLDRGENLLDTHGYVWGQTDSVVHLFVPARGVKMKKSKEVTLEVKPSSLHLSMPSKPATASEAAVEMFSIGNGTSADLFELRGPLHKAIKPDECSWQLEDGGLLLHVELAKRDVDEEREHWFCVWNSHPHTRAPSKKEREKVHDMAKAACVQEKLEPKEVKMPTGAEERLKGLRDQFPGMNIEWGDTSLDAFRE